MEIQPRLSFRNDINGLRAIAVGLVLLFHFQVPGFSGGFAGVDIFFVISGFLMTQIIIEGLGRETFSIPAFYMSRGRRIIPPLLSISGAVMMFGWFFLLPTDLLLLSKHVASAVAFLSNFVFWLESGYFAPDSASNWMLHTWSLSVEWQFYMLYPLLLLALARFSRGAVIAGAAATLAVSFAISCYWSTSHPTAGFFLLPSRAWEMLTGGFVYLVPVKASKWMEMAGLALIVLAASWLSDPAGWPGWHAAIPVIGTALVIAAKQNASVFTANPISYWLGRRSYSVYLWHWPIVVGLNYYGFPHSIPTIVAAVVAALFLGHLSFEFIEQRSGKIWPFGQRFNPSGLARMSVVPLVIALLCSAIWYSRGAPFRFSEEIQLADAEALDMNKSGEACFARYGEPKPSCVLGPRPWGIELIGDSHASASLSALAAASARHRSGVLYHAYAACASILGLRSIDPTSECLRFNDKYLRPLLSETDPRPLVIINAWSQYLTHKGYLIDANPISEKLYETGLEGTVCAVARHRPVYMTLPFPLFAKPVPQTLARTLENDPDAPDISMNVSDYETQNAFEIAMLRDVSKKCSVHLLNPKPYLCPHGRCMGSLHHRPLYFDEGHLSEYGNKLLIPMFAAIFKGDATAVGTQARTHAPL